MNPPFLVAAFFCENVLMEQDGVASAIRIVDRLFITRIKATTVGPGAPSPAQTINLYISFKGGGYVGKATIKLTNTSPSGKKGKVQEMPVDFPPEPNSGANMVVKAVVAFEEEGVYWFEIYCNNVLATRTPLDVQLATAAMHGSQSPEALQKP